MKKLSLIILAITLIAVSAVSGHCRTIHAEWQYQSQPNHAGFRLYHEGSMLCQIADPNATSASCTLSAADGPATFTLTAYYNDNSETDHSEVYTYIFSSTLQAKFTATPQSGTAPLQVSFDGQTSTGSITSYEWMFGDGDTATGSTTNHTYTSAGTYTATLKVTDSVGAVDYDSLSIVVPNSSGGGTPPVAVISTSTAAGEAPLTVQFDGTGSSDSDGSIVSYSWDLGDGNTSTGAQITHTYTVSGTYHPTLTVTDNDGLINSISTPVIVTPPSGTNLPPTGVISASSNNKPAPLKITFDGSHSNDPDGSIIEYLWNFGDGTSTAGKTVDHTYYIAGTYSVSLQVRDNLGALSTPVYYSVIVTSNTDKRSKSLLPIFNLLLKELKN